jgi:hypothetical protein
MVENVAIKIWNAKANNGECRNVILNADANNRECSNKNPE